MRNTFFRPNYLNRKGFTLIELLIAIAIIAILATIAVTVFGNAQRDGRNARRRADIAAIAKSLEVNKTNNNSATYAALATTMFANGVIPADPISTNVAPDNACPGVCKYCVKAAVGTCAIADTTVAAAQPPAGATFIVCANIEGGGFFCRQNQQ